METTLKPEKPDPDTELAEWLIGLGNDDEERLETLNRFMASGYKDKISISRWITMVELYKLLQEKTTARRSKTAVEQIMREISR
jgi:hypothetical protein